MRSSAPTTSVDKALAHAIEILNSRPEVALNQALCEALDDGDGTAIAMPDELRDDFIRSFETLLSQAKKAGAVRADIDIAAVLDLVVGVAAAERRARLRGAPNQLIAVALDGLRFR